MLIDRCLTPISIPFLVGSSRKEGKNSDPSLLSGSFGGLLPGMDPGMLPLMYPGLPGFLSGMPPVPPGLVPGQSNTQVLPEHFNIHKCCV